MDRLFFLLYSTLAVLANILAIPFLLFLALTKKRYKHSIWARFFAFANPPFSAGGIWFHVCSLGEARAISPLLDLLPKEKLRLTSITQTGYEALSQKLPGQSRFLPFEPWLFPWIRPQRVLIVAEAELWYLLFVLAKKKGAKTILLNARISDRSFPKYKRVSFLYKQIFRYVDSVFAQTEEDRIRLEQLGAKNVSVLGNIKLFRLPEARGVMRRSKHPLVCAASTHKGEELLIMRAYLQLKAKEEDAQLVIAPRHPERFDEVAQMVALFSLEHRLSYARYSEKGLGEEEIVVLDTLGELVELYSVSDVVIMGGSFVPAGGHNAAEAAQFGCRIISGKSWHNQKDIYAAIEGLVITSSADLGEVLQAYENLPHTIIKNKVNIDPLFDLIDAAMQERKED